MELEKTTDDFENWLRSVCFQEPTKEAYDLAKSAWSKCDKQIEILKKELMLLQSSFDDRLRINDLQSKDKDILEKKLREARETIKYIEGIRYSHIGCAVHNRVAREYRKKIL